jgi:hypothetical protein
MQDAQSNTDYRTSYDITGLKSFSEVTKEPRQIAGLYFYQLTDCLIDLAYQVSGDFRARPQLYRHLGEPTMSQTLARLNAQYGTEIGFLSKEQRSAIYKPVFGPWQGPPAADDSFPRLRDDLILAAKAFAEHAVTRGIEQLRAGVRSAHRPFKDYLVELHGDSVRFSKDIALAELTETYAYPILRDQGVQAVFSIRKDPADRTTEYPYATDPAEDLLMEQISKQLSPPDVMPYTRERISNLQRAALRGAEAIAAVIDFEEAHADEASTDLLEVLITKCYTWGTALDSLSSATMVPLQSSSQPVASAASPTSTKAPTAYPA